MMISGFGMRVGVVRWGSVLCDGHTCLNSYDAHGNYLRKGA